MDAEHLPISGLGWWGGGLEDGIATVIGTPVGVNPWFAVL